MQKNLLIMSEMPQYFINLADKNFNTHKLWLQNESIKVWHSRLWQDGKDTRKVDSRI